MSVLYLTDSSDTAKVNLDLVVYASEKYTVYLTSPVCWVMTGNDYSNAQCLGSCTRSASKQARWCLFEFSILYCHMSLCCLEFTLCDGSFPSSPLHSTKKEKVTGSSPEVEGVCVCVRALRGDNGTESVWQMSYFITMPTTPPRHSATWEERKPGQVYIRPLHGVNTITGTCLLPWNATNLQWALPPKKILPR